MFAALKVAITLAFARLPRVVLYEVFAFLKRRVTFWATRAHDVVG